MVIQLILQMVGICLEMIKRSVVMLGKAKNIVADIKADAERKKEEKERLKKEQQEQAERLELERKDIEARREAERRATEEAKIQAEKEFLMSLSEKELLVEIVMALRGLYSRIEEIEEEYADLDEAVSVMKGELKSMKTEAVRKDLEITNIKLQNL